MGFFVVHVPSFDVEYFFVAIAIRFIGSLDIRGTLHSVGWTKFRFFEKCQTFGIVVAE